MTMSEETGSKEKDAEEMKTLLSGISQGAKDARKVVQSLIAEVKESGDTEGISFLDMKNTILASYTSNLAYLMLKKCHGKSIENEAAVERLVEQRTVLEKIRPIDQKLRYQVDKMVSIAENGQIDMNDPLRFKPNPGGLMSKLDEDSDSEVEEDSKEPSKQKFKPPMNVPQFFKENTDDAQSAEDGEKSKKRAISRSIMESIKEQYSENPEEISHKTDVMRKKLIDEERERTRIEEEHFIRLPVTKADKLRRKELLTMSSVGDDITSFGRSVYDDTESGQPGTKRKKSHGGKKKGGKKLKKRKF